MVGLGGFFWAIIIGGIAGWVASMIMKTNASMGVIANIVVGVVGAIIGNLLLPVFGFSTTNGPTVYSFIVALIGALVLLFLIRLVRR